MTLILGLPSIKNFLLFVKGIFKRQKKASNEKLNINMDDARDLEFGTQRVSSTKIVNSKEDSSNDLNLDSVHLSIPDMRKFEMIRGRHPDHLYRTGESQTETLLRLQLASPEPESRVPQSEVQGRLQIAGDVMTKLKSEEMLFELPSKRLLLKYVGHQCSMCFSSFRNDLKEHFNIKRNEDSISQILCDIYESDLENGMTFRSSAKH